jgi:general secretion pathway protein K
MSRRDRTGRTGLAPVPAPSVRQQGAALLTVLLLVAVMSVLMLGVLDDVRFALRRAGNAQAMEQAQWHALGAERLAHARILQLLRRDPARTTLAGDWHDRALLLPVDDGAGGTGLVQARLRDATACFNLNSVVEGAGEQWRRRDDGVLQFVALLDALDVPEARAWSLAESLVDWIDSDQRPEPRGAEDPAYLARSPGYRTAGTLLSEVSELRAVAGFDARLYDRLRPHACALASAAPTPVNVNTIGDAHAPLLQALTHGRVDARRARRAIAARPGDGWRDVAAFWSQSAFSGIELPDDALGQVALRTRYFDLHAQVEYAGAQVELSALIEHAGGDAIHTLVRRWTAHE